MELNRAKECEKRQRLSQPNPNHEPVEPPAVKPKKRRRKKRPRSDNPPNPTSAERRADGREVLYYSSSDEDVNNSNQGSGERGRGEEQEEEEKATGGFDSDLASYKKLLSALESRGGAGIGRAKRVFGASVGGVEDKELAAAIVARRMQREGRDDSYGSDSSSSEDGEDEDDAEGEREDGDDKDDVDGESDGDDDGENDNLQAGDSGSGHQEGEENEDGEAETEASNGALAASALNGDADADADADDTAADGNASDEDDDEARPQGGKLADGRSRDEFCRHFVSTPVFPAEKAAELLSARGRPSFKPLPSGSARGKWGGVGLSAVVSTRVGTKEDDVAPPALPKGASISAELGVLPSLAKGWDACNGGPASKLQSLLLPPLAGYRDMLYCGWRDEDAEDIRRSYALHALNHALTSQRRVVRHNARLRKAAEEARVAEALARAGKKATANGTGGGDADGTKAATSSSSSSANANANANGNATSGQNQPRTRSGAKGAGTPAPSAASPRETAAEGGGGGGDAKQKDTVELESDDWQRDQGFTRPKVLILLPFRGLAHEVVEIMIGLLGPKTVAVNKDRFDEEYGPDLDEDGEGGGIDGAEVDGSKQAAARAERAKAVLERKPADWKALFGEGRNVDDMFTLGISLSPGGGKGKPGEGKGVGMRLYCDFYNSDIIIASPVALHRASVPGEGGGEGGAGGGGGVDSDFLSSVEVCILDRADVFLMQNWAYVPEIAEVLNSRPTGERAARADFSRVRPLFLHEQGRLFRQTLVFSAFQVCVSCSWVFCVCEGECGGVKESEMLLT